MAACWRVCFQLMQIFFIIPCNKAGLLFFSYCPWISPLSPILLIYISNPCQAHIHILNEFPYFLFLFSASITSFACSYSDINKTTCSWQLTPSVISCSCFHWSTWSQLIQIGFLFSTPGFIFNRWVYFPVDFGYVLIIFSFFHILLLLIVYSMSVFLYGFSVLSFNFSLLLLGLLQCCPSSSSS